MLVSHLRGDISRQLAMQDKMTIHLSCESESEVLSRFRLFATPRIVACAKLLRLWDFQGKSTGVGCHFLLQGILLTQGSNPGLSHCRQTLYRLSHQERLSCRCVDSLGEEGRLISRGTLEEACEISTPSGHHHIITSETTKISRFL